MQLQTWHSHGRKPEIATFVPMSHGRVVQSFGPSPVSHSPKPSKPPNEPLPRNHKAKAPQTSQAAPRNWSIDRNARPKTRRRNGIRQRDDPPGRGVPFAAGVCATRRPRTATAGYPPASSATPGGARPGNPPRPIAARTAPIAIRFSHPRARARAPPPRHAPTCAASRHRMPRTAPVAACQPDTTATVLVLLRRLARNLYIPELAHSPARSSPPPLSQRDIGRHKPRTESHP